MEGMTKAHCHKTSGRFPICILHLSFGSEGNRLPNGEQTTQTKGRCSSPRATLTFHGYKLKSTLVELANSLLNLVPHSVNENCNFISVSLLTSYLFLQSVSVV